MIESGLNSTCRGLIYAEYRGSAPQPRLKNLKAGCLWLRYVLVYVSSTLSLPH